jgi:hypothetical protein
LIAIGMILLLPVIGRAQDAAVSGTVIDSTGGVLPGVTVTGLHEASGNTFVGVTDERGEFRIPVRTGAYKITAELSGFATLTTNLELAVGQQAVVSLRMLPATLNESVTVTGQAALVEVTQSKLGGNVDTRQMQEIPVNGRNWMQLTLLVPGSRSNGSLLDSPVEREYTATVFQLNIDGQQVTDIQGQSASGEPRFSRDAIAEFEVTTNRFDATQGRTSGLQVNAVTKSGTNTFVGTLSGYFRDDRFKAADFVAHRVLKYSDQQVSGTFGGPIRKDTAHFFGYYESEREPQTIAFASPFPAFNIPDLTATRVEHKFGVRFDTQFSSSTHLMVRGNRWIHHEPFASRCPQGPTVHPSTVCGGEHRSDQTFMSLTRTLGNRAVNEIKAGYNSIEWNYDHNGLNGTFNDRPSGCAARSGGGAVGPVPGLLTPDDGHPPRILLRGYTLGTGTTHPHCVGEDTYQVRDSLTAVFGIIGHHQIKVGGEYLHDLNHLWYPQLAYGQIDATGGPIPANIQAIFPVWDDWKTWNLAALSSVTRFYTKAFANSNSIYDPIHTGAAWAQDDWAVAKRLTVNLGVRYDVSLGSIGDRLDPFPPFRPANLIRHDLLNIAPRLGFAYAHSSKTVIRGGWGKYYAQPQDFAVYWTEVGMQRVVPSAVNDGRPNFAADPYNGQIPTAESIIASGVRRDVAMQMIDPATYHTQHSYQASIGFQQQVGETMSIQADYAYTASRGEAYVRNANLGYNPATGVNYRFTDISHLPFPNWGLVPMYFGDGYSNYHGLQTAFTKRFSSRWQASVTYTLSGLWDAVGSPDVGFKVAPDLGGEYGLAVTDQRHRAVFNGIWQIGHGLQVSGLYFFGSGLRYATSYGADLRNVGTGGSARLRPDGTIVPRNDFVGLPIHRVDARLQRRFSIHGRLGVDGLVEVFNLFNHANYGSYTTTEVSPAYGRPSQNPNLPYQPRTMQLAFRFVF